MEQIETITPSAELIAIALISIPYRLFLVGVHLPGIRAFSLYSAKAAMLPLLFKRAS